MGGQDLEHSFLLKLVEDISTIRTTVANLESQLDKVEDKVVDPFQKWVHETKSTATDVAELKLTVVSQQNKIIDINRKLDNVKYYVLGACAVLASVGTVIYKVFELLMK